MKDVLTHLIKPKRRYNQNLRKFSLVLSIKSKAAYNWVRNKFSKRLPTIRTLRKWNANSSANCFNRSGVNFQTKSTLKTLAQKKNAAGKELYVSLCFDEVSIRQHVQWIHDEKRFSGFINYAQRKDDDVPVANFAIFFLVTLIESAESLIFAYYLIKSLDTDEKSALIKNIIQEINSTGCYLMSIAFDGLATNFSACEKLGASFDMDDFRPFIPNVDDSKRICIVMDPPHCLKLIRNCIAEKENLRDGNGNSICWSFFEKLVNTNSELATHKMTRKHIEFHSNKMNVRIAAQTLSLSVAKSMELLVRNRNASFANAVGTIIFTKNFNKGFDIFNAKHSNSNNIFKQGLNLKTAEKIFEFLDYFAEYIKSIKYQGQYILNTQRKTGFLGFLMNREALKYFYDEFVSQSKIENILFFYFGQDLLESLFGRIRSMLGANTNPTAQQLVGVTRQLMNFNEIKASEEANCQDELNILTVTSAAVDKNTNSVEKSSTHICPDVGTENSSIFDVELNFKQLHTIKLRAGTIEKKIRNAIPRCKEVQCANIFNINADKIDGIFFENFIAQRPTKSTFKICQIVYRMFILHSNAFTFDYKKMYQNILNAIQIDELYMNIDFSHNPNHKSQFILLIIDEYIRIHATHSARQITLQIHSKIIGSTINKLKHILGQ